MCSFVRAAEAICPMDTVTLRTRALFVTYLDPHRPAICIA